MRGLIYCRLQLYWRTAGVLLVVHALQIAPHLLNSSDSSSIDIIHYTARVAYKGQSSRTGLHMVYMLCEQCYRAHL
jgi:hypothetical protein